MTHADKSLRFCIANAAVTLATLVVILLALAGGLLMPQFDLSMGTLKIVTAIFLAHWSWGRAMGIPSPQEAIPDPEAPTKALAITPVAFPGILPPQGIAFRRPRPEVVIQDVWPPYTLTLNIPTGEKNQPNVYLISRCAAAAKLQDKGEEFLDHVMHMMWVGTVDNWPDYLAEYMNRAGMDGEAVLAGVHANPAKYDAVFDEVAKAKSKTGSGGVPEMVFRGEPFFGQDMFDSFFWRYLKMD